MHAYAYICMHIHIHLQIYIHICKHWTENKQICFAKGESISRQMQINFKPNANHFR